MKDKKLMDILIKFIQNKSYSDAIIAIKEEFGTTKKEDFLELYRIYLYTVF